MLASKLHTASTVHTSRGSQRAAKRVSVIPHGLKENVQALPSIEGIQKVVLQPMDHTIPNQEGKKASVAIYAHLAQKYGGLLNEAAANEGLSLYAEVVEDARSHPGHTPTSTFFSLCWHSQIRRSQSKSTGSNSSRGSRCCSKQGRIARVLLYTTQLLPCQQAQLRLQQPQFYFWVMASSSWQLHGHC